MYFIHTCFDDIFFDVTKYTSFTVNSGTDFKLKTEHLEIAKNKTIDRIKCVELSHTMSFLAFCVSVLMNGYDRALFMEDDINFMRMQDDRVLGRKGIIEWDENDALQKAIETHEQTASEFRERFSNALTLCDEIKPQREIIYVGSGFGQKNKMVLKEGDKNKDHSDVVEPSCAFTLHAVIVTKEAARKFLSCLFPIWYSTDVMVHFCKGARAEFFPNLISKDIFWEVWKGEKSSSMPIDRWKYDKAIELMKANKCTPDIDQSKHYMKDIGMATGAAVAGLGFTRLTLDKKKTNSTKRRTARSTSAKNMQS